MTAWVNRMPGVSRAIASQRSLIALVRSSETESGSWTLASRYPMSWVGMNPAGVLVNRS